MKNNTSVMDKKIDTNYFEIITKSLQLYNFLYNKKFTSNPNDLDTRLHKSIGRGENFISHRNFEYGDEKKYIDWKKSAISDDSLFLKEYEKEILQKVIFIIDERSLYGLKALSIGKINEIFFDQISKSNNLFILFFALFMLFENENYNIELLIINNQKKNIYSKYSDNFFNNKKDAMQSIINKSLCFMNGEKIDKKDLSRNYFLLTLNNILNEANPKNSFFIISDFLFHAEDINNFFGKINSKIEKITYIQNMAQSEKLDKSKNYIFFDPYEEHSPKKFVNHKIHIEEYKKNIKDNYLSLKNNVKKSRNDFIQITSNEKIKEIAKKL